MQRIEVPRERIDLASRRVENVPDVAEPEAELAQQQDPLQPHERVLVVIPVAIRCDTAGRE